MIIRPLQLLLDFHDICWGGPYDKQTHHSIKRSQADLANSTRYHSLNFVVKAYHMICEVTRHCEALSTNSAFKWTPPRMNTHMSVQIATAIKYFTTPRVGTRKSPFHGIRVLRRLSPVHVGRSLPWGPLTA